ncbi:polysaccharide deacetylase family protein [Nostocoides sp.]
MPPAGVPRHGDDRRRRATRSNPTTATSGLTATARGGSCAVSAAVAASPSPSTTGPTGRPRRGSSTSSRARHLRATFFVTGHRMDGDGEVARRNRAVLLRAWRAGHLVGNHTYHHDLHRHDGRGRPCASRSTARRRSCAG